MNFVPNKLIAVDDIDPPWETKEIQKLLKDKRKLYKKYIKNGKKKGNKNKLNHQHKNRKIIFKIQLKNWVTQN